ncbi:class I SAM-dependent methyltransferase [Solitalea sp. MAHUQ-68]|uniref:Class I SAM-dependent methyltransferase n=1 Tax=Solitalea agri TaxID=2953739 RepID=A0A9X2JDN4_9SPHI|nr:class I SAM-dependent methyltransferase [Solitalea agri]MCO4291551.1 class I SAM-dependent methyltransferase [Solitalea agri]
MGPSATVTDFFSANKTFDSLYSKNVQQLSGKHWTPMLVAVKAANYLAETDGAKILDIGSGVGKFCLIGAKHFDKCSFYGVEQRKDLIAEAERVRNILKIKNVDFIHNDFAKLNFDDYQHFYFYNSFFENLVEEEDVLIDNHFSNSGLYERYTNALHKILKDRPSGTKLVTYQSTQHEIPADYQLIESHFNSKLNFWLKK